MTRFPKVYLGTRAKKKESDVRSVFPAGLIFLGHASRQRPNSGSVMGFHPLKPLRVAGILISQLSRL